MAQILTQDDHFVGVTVAFFDDHTPPRPAKIDVSDRQPAVIVNNPAVAVPANVVVAADGMSMTFDLEAGIVGSTEGAIDVDVNLANGEDTSLVISWGDTVEVTPGAPGQAVSGTVAFPAASPKA